MSDSTSRVGVDFVGSSGSVVAAARESAAAVQSVSKGVAAANVETTKFSGAAKGAERDLGSLSRGALAGTGVMSGFGKSVAYASAAFLGGAGLIEVVKSAIDGAETLQKAHASLDTSIARLGGDIKAATPLIDQWAEKQAKFGVSISDSEQGLARLIPLTGSVTKAMEAYTLALELSKGDNIGLSQAETAVAKALDGKATSLQRYGIVLGKNASDEQVATAISARFGGQAEANTTSLDRLHATLSNVETTIGEDLLPTFEKGAADLDKWFSNQQNVNRVTGDAKQIIHDTATVAETFFADANKVVGVLGGWKTVLEVIVGIKVVSVVSGWVTSIKTFASALDAQLVGIGKLATAWDTVAASANGATAAEERAAGGAGAAGAGAGAAAAGGGASLASRLGGVATGIAAAAAGVFAFGSIGSSRKAKVVNGRYVNPFDGSDMGPAGSVAGQAPAGLSGLAGSPFLGGFTAVNAGAASGKAKLLAFAKSALGTPYLWGGTGPGGFDCSGLVQWAFANGLDVSIPRTTYEQATTGRQVSPGSAKVGDVVFTNYGEGGNAGPGHEGLIVGFDKTGQPIIEAAPHTGSAVQTYTGYSAFTGGGQFTVRDLLAKSAGSVFGGSIATPAAAAAAKAKKPTVVSGGALVPGSLNNQISQLADKAKSAAGQQLVADLKAEYADVEKAISDISGKLKGASPKETAAVNAELSTLTNKARDLRTAITDAVASKDIQQIVTTATAKLKAEQAQNKTLTDKASRDATSAISTNLAGAAKIIAADYTTIANNLASQQQTLLAERNTLTSRLAGADRTVAAQIRSQVSKINTSLGSISTAIQSNLQSEESQLQSAISQAAQQVSSTWSSVQSDIISEFEAQTNAYIQNVLGPEFFQNGAQTPAEAQLASMQAQDQVDQLNQALASAQASGDQSQIAQAQRAIAEYQVSIQATQERAAADKQYAQAVQQYTDQRTVEEHQLSAALDVFGTSLANGTGNLSDLDALLAQYGIPAMSGLSDVSAQLYKSDFPNLSTAVQTLTGLIDALNKLLSGGTSASSTTTSTTTPGATITTGTLPPFFNPAQNFGGVLIRPGQRIALAAGGTVRVPGRYIGRDSVPALLSPGETVIDRRMTAALERIVTVGGGTTINATVLGATERQVGAALERLVTPAAKRVVSYPAPRL